MALKDLEKTIGYTFRNKSLLEQALTHKSCGKVNNEKLEFLGDSILNAWVSVWLMERFPNASEGLLSLKRAELVAKKTLSHIACNWDVLKHMNTKLPDEHLTRGTKNITSDAVEAIIAAVYLDSDWSQCGQFLYPWFEQRINNAGSINQHDKTALQEWCQRAKMSLPHYQSQDMGDHFVVSCHIEGIDRVTSGTARSKREAEMFAASEMLSRLKEKS